MATQCYIALAHNITIQSNITLSSSYSGVISQPKLNIFNWFSTDVLYFVCSFRKMKKKMRNSENRLFDDVTTLFGGYSYKSLINELL